MFFVAHTVSSSLKTGVHSCVGFSTCSRVVHSTRGHVTSAAEVREGVVCAATSSVGWSWGGDETTALIFNSTFAFVRVSAALPSSLNTAPNTGTRVHAVHSLVVFTGNYCTWTGPCSLIVTSTGSARGRWFGDGTSSTSVTALAGVVGVTTTVALTLQAGEDRGIRGWTGLRVWVPTRGQGSGTHPELVVRALAGIAWWCRIVDRAASETVLTVTSQFSVNVAPTVTSSLRTGQDTLVRFDTERMVGLVTAYNLTRALPGSIVQTPACTVRRGRCVDTAPSSWVHTVAPSYICYHLLLRDNLVYIWQWVQGICSKLKYRSRKCQSLSSYPVQHVVYKVGDHTSGPCNIILLPTCLAVHSPCDHVREETFSLVNSRYCGVPVVLSGGTSWQTDGEYLVGVRQLYHGFQSSQGCVEHVVCQVDEMGPGWSGGSLCCSFQVDIRSHPNEHLAAVTLAEQLSFQHLHYFHACQSLHTLSKRYYLTVNVDKSEVVEISVIHYSLEDPVVRSVASADPLKVTHRSSEHVEITGTVTRDSVVHVRHCSCQLVKLYVYLQSISSRSHGPCCNVLVVYHVSYHVEFSVGVSSRVVFLGQGHAPCRSDQQ